MISRDKMPVCDYCGRPFDSLQGLRRHLGWCEIRKQAKKQRGGPVPSAETGVKPIAGSIYKDVLPSPLQVIPQVPTYVPYQPLPAQPPQPQPPQQQVPPLVIKIEGQGREERPLTVVDIREIISREMMERGREKPLTKEDIREIISREMAERGGGEKPLTKEDLGEMIEEATSKEAPIEAPPKEAPSIENQVRQIFEADREERKKQDESLRPAREAQEELDRRMDKLLKKIERSELPWMNEEVQPEKPKPVPVPSGPPKIAEATSQAERPQQPTEPVLTPYQLELQAKQIAEKTAVEKVQEMLDRKSKEAEAEREEEKVGEGGKEESKEETPPEETPREEESVRRGILPIFRRGRFRLLS